MSSAFHQLCPIYSGTLTPTAPTFTTINSVDLAHYRVSRAKDWVSVDCGRLAIAIAFSPTMCYCQTSGNSIFPDFMLLPDVCVMSDKNLSWKKLGPKLSKQPLFTTVKKYKSYSSLVKKYDIFSLQTI